MGSSGVTFSTSLPADDGNAATGTATGAPRVDHVHPRTRWKAADVGWLTWTHDPAVPSSNSVPSSGVLQLARLHLPTAQTITNIILEVVTGGTNLVSGQCFAVLFSATGAKKGITADQSAVWNTAGLKTMALGATYAAPAGDLYVGWWAVHSGGTIPAFLRAGNTAAVNGGLVAPNLRFATADGSLTTTSPDPFGTQTAASIGWFAALS
jgi:hypothetical protein